MGPHIDAYRVDVKGFTAEAYHELCRIKDFGPVLAAAVRAQSEHGCHVEIVTNVVPTVNDDPDALRALADWIVAELGPKTPWHVTRFMPYLELSHLSGDAGEDPRTRRRHRARSGARVRVRRQRARPRRREHGLPEL